MSEIYEDRDFYRPIATPYDVEVALNPNATPTPFSYSYNAFLSSSSDLPTERDELKTDVSLLTGRLRSDERSESEEEVSGVVCVKPKGTVATNAGYGAGYLSQRTWKGLEQNLGQSAAKEVEEGLSGLAGAYENEPMA